MGCDGGTIPKRDELVRTKKKPEQKDKHAEVAARWRHCCLSQELLQPPIVACELGRLYNKEKVIEFLLDRSSVETASQFDHIRNLKDVTKLSLTPNPAYRGNADINKSGLDQVTSPYICPISGLEMTGKFRFCFLLTCGCVFSERAMKEVKDSCCVQCGKPYNMTDVILLNGSDEETEELRTKMEQRRADAKLNKKAKKRKNGESTAENGAASNGSSNNELTTVTTKKSKLEVGNGDKLKTSGRSVNGMSSAVGNVVNGSSGKSKSERGIQNDPSASSIYKSLFNSHHTAKNQPKAHWVTHNPQYF